MTGQYILSDYLDRANIFRLFVKDASHKIDFL